MDNEQSEGGFSMKNKDRTFSYRATEESELLPLLLNIISNKSRNSIKSILARGQVSVDGQSITKHNYPVQAGQLVEIVDNRAAIGESSLSGISILFEDEDILVIEKEAGLLTVAGKDKSERTAYSELMNYVKQINPRNRIFIVHRLDRDTSGVLIFAKSEEVKKQLQDNWDDVVKERLYTALVEGNLKKEKGTIQSYLKETRTYKVYSNPTDNGGQLSITHFRKIRGNRQFTLVAVELETGRKNQIRVHMQDIGHPVVGDKKYGSTVNPIKRLGLHATALTILHPRTGEIMRFECEVPTSFVKKSL